MRTLVAFPSTHPSPLDARRLRRWVFAALSVAITPPSIAQTTIPTRTTTRVASTDPGVLSGVGGVRQLPQGRVLVNDVSRHRLLVFDSTLTRFAVVLDTAGGSGQKYGLWQGTLIPYLADSTLFVDVGAKAFVLIDPAGSIVRTIAPPNANDLTYITGNICGAPGIDAQGRILYCGRRAPPPPPDTARTRTVLFFPDSAPILRGDFDRRTVDTVATVGISRQKVVVDKIKTGENLMNYAFNPLPSPDEWAVLPDGTIAIVRSKDYHVDWLTPDGKMTASPKMPFDWRRIERVEKEKILDSVRTAADAIIATLSQVERDHYVFSTVDVDELPDYYPPIRRGQVKADADGNVWMLPTTSSLRDRKLDRGPRNLRRLQAARHVARGVA